MSKRFEIRKASEMRPGQVCVRFTSNDLNADIHTMQASLSNRLGCWQASTARWGEPHPLNLTFLAALVEADERRLSVLPGYEQLASTLDAALEQAQSGKGKERHHTEGVPYHEQPAVTICRSLGSNHFAIGQAIKKARESARLPNDRARLELLGAINYLAAAYIALGGDS